MKSMPRIQIIALVLLGVGMNLSARAQSTSQSDTAPAPAFGQQNAPILSPENPPVSGLDEPALELRTATRSFISPALQVSESADTNPNNQLGTSDLSSITRVLGALDLQQFWPKSDLFAEYVGGAAFYSNPFDVRQLHAAGVEAVTRWRTGQATFRDAFSYLPDGAFNLGFGGVPGYGIAVGQGLGTGLAGTLPGAIRNDTLGSIGDIPRLSNTAILDAVQAINPVSAFTVAGAFSNAHFYDPSNTLLNSDQLTVQGGYARLVSRHDQFGFIYAFQLFQFPQTTGGQVYNHIVNLRWSHTISGRMSLTAGAGPQYTELEQGGYYKHWSVSARVQLHYKFAAFVDDRHVRKIHLRGIRFLRRRQYPNRTPWIHATAAHAPGNSSGTCPIPITPGCRRWDSSRPSSSTMKARLWRYCSQASGRTYDFFVSYRFGEVGFNAPFNFDGNTGTLSSGSRRDRAWNGIPAPTQDRVIILWPPRAAGLVNSMSENRELTMDDYLAMLRRRLKVILIPALLAPLAGFLVLMFPPKYTSASTVLVEGQKVPEAYVEPVITSDFTQRVQTLSQEVHGPTRLRPVIQGLALVKPEEEDKLIAEITAQKLQVEPGDHLDERGRKRHQIPSTKKKKPSITSEPVRVSPSNYSDSDPPVPRKLQRPDLVDPR